MLNPVIKLSWFGRRANPRVMLHDESRGGIEDIISAA